MKLVCTNPNLLGRTFQVGGGLGSITVPESGEVDVSPAHALKLMTDLSSWRRAKGDQAAGPAPAPAPTLKLPPMAPPATMNVVTHVDPLTGDVTYERRLRTKEPKKTVTRRRSSESEE
jgi:hypothetical protein